MTVPFPAVFILLVLPCVLAAQGSDTASFGVEERVRSENWNNVFDLNGATDDEGHQIRYRTRLWAALPATHNLNLNLGLSSETYQKPGHQNRLGDVVFETANLDIPKLFVRGLSLKVGRQDFSRGEGLVFADGTSGDGSRTSYFNAARLAYSFRKSTLEAVGILDPKMDRFLPVDNDPHDLLQEWDEQALGLYYTDNNLAHTSIEGYCFHKKETHDYRPATDRQFQPDRRIETLGGRIAHRLGRHWSATSEAAGQWGLEHPRIPTRAWAGYGYMKRTFDSDGQPYLLGGYWALSGNWDPLFARWPKWGDLDAYTQLAEKGIGYPTNLKRLQMEAGFSAHQRMAWRFTYYHVTAFGAVTGNSLVFGSGLNRGEIVQGRLDFTLNARLRGHVDYQTLIPGSFYSHHGRAYFLRFEMIAQVTTTVNDFRRRLLGR